MPSFCIASPRCLASSYTASGELLPGNERGDGAGPISDDSRLTRPPSSSTLTAAGSGPGEVIWGSAPLVSIERSGQPPMKVPPTWYFATTARASSASVTPTINSWASLSRTPMANRASSLQTGAADGGNGPATGFAALGVGNAVAGGMVEWRLEYSRRPAE